MNKPAISKDEGLLKKICNDAFFAVKGKMPERIRESESYDRIFAFVLGFGAGYAVAESGENLIEHLNDNYSTDIPLEEVTSHSLAITAGAPVAARIIMPKYLKAFINENPRYSAGVAGVMSGAALKSIYHLIQNF
jgi:hypothetical protein